MITPGEIKQAIDDATLARRAERQTRPHLGASEIGDECLRKVWYKFRSCGQEFFDARKLRLFERGSREEPVFTQHLQDAGFEVHVPTPETEESFRFRDCESHFCGTADGVVSMDGEDYLVEFKTYGSKNFADLKRNQSVRDNDPKYFFQIQTYLGQLGLKACLFCAVNKNDDDLYFEFVDYDIHSFGECMSKATVVINSSTPPPKVSDNPESWMCKGCFMRRVCHEGVLPLQNCRSCKFGSPAAAGTWECGKGQPFGKVCQQYQPITK